MWKLRNTYCVRKITKTSLFKNFSILPLVSLRTQTVFLGKFCWKIWNFANRILREPEKKIHEKNRGRKFRDFVPLNRKYEDDLSWTPPWIFFELAILGRRICLPLGSSIIDLLHRTTHHPIIKYDGLFSVLWKFHNLTANGLWRLCQKGSVAQDSQHLCN